MKLIITSSTPSNQFERKDISLIPTEFDQLVYSKGEDVLYEKAILCPCRSKSNASPLASCLNCGGSGYLFVNANKTKMVIQSLTSKTKYTQWSKETLGTSVITSRSIDKISYFDRITLLNSEATYSQILYPQVYKDVLFSFTVYNILSIDVVFLFVGENIPLRRLGLGVDYFFTKGENKIIFSNDLSSIENLTTSIRYQHYSAYGILELLKEFRVSPGNDSLGRNIMNLFPFNAVGRKYHYIIDSLNSETSGVIDNSFIN
jgi:hypothetical protein